MGLDGLGPDPVGDLQELAERQLLAAATAQRALQQLRSEGEAERGLVRVTVGAGGALQDLQLDPRAMRLDSRSLREAILAAYGRAVEDLEARTDEIMAPLIGGQSYSEVMKYGFDVDAALRPHGRSLADLEHRLDSALPRPEERR
jgi:DNA-binding protein YbaB